MKLPDLIKKFKRVYADEGFLAVIQRILKYVGGLRRCYIRCCDIYNARYTKGNILFVIGHCTENPIRYRVLHQMEQLKLAKISCAKIYIDDITWEMEKNFELFVFYRCECTERISQFIDLARMHGKKLCFDVDDLVVDKNYVEQIPFVKTLPPATRRYFEESICSMRRTLNRCDIATTTTGTLAKVLSESGTLVYVNRNVASKEMIERAEMAYRKKQRDSEMVWLGYFSGSSTHDEDFEIIRPVLVRLLTRYPNVGLLVVGEVNISDEFVRFRDRVKKKTLVSWKKLPLLISQIDINLAPLADTVFNCAKSEIKWIEAALVHIPTVASNLGAFEEMMENHVTGILCENRTDIWEQELEILIKNSSYRQSIAERAYEMVMKNCTVASSLNVYIDLLGNIKSDDSCGSKQ